MLTILFNQYVKVSGGPTTTPATRNRTRLVRQVDPFSEEAVRDEEDLMLVIGVFLKTGDNMT